MKRARRVVGDFLAIPLGDGTFGFGRVLTEPLVAFYDVRAESAALPEGLASRSVLFKIFVMNHLIKSGEWPVVGREPLSEDLLVEPMFYKIDALNGAYCLYRDSTGEEIPATESECAGYEQAAVWEGWEVVERLQAALPSLG